MIQFDWISRMMFTAQCEFAHNQRGFVQIETMTDGLEITLVDDYSHQVIKHNGSDVRVKVFWNDLFFPKDEVESKLDEILELLRK